MNDFWRKQIPGESLFPDVLWNKPERKSVAGKLAIVGGNVQGFAAVAAAHQISSQLGIGAIKIILPDVLKRKIPPIITDAIFSPSNLSGGFARDAIIDLRAAADFADAILFIGDNGANSETAALFETFLRENQKTPAILTRDAVDLVKNSAEDILNRENTHFVVSFSQLQKIFREIYYPRVLTFSQGIKQIAETLHKFTITYPATITLWHENNLICAKSGEVISQNFDQPLRVWSGEVATRETVWQIWQNNVIKAIAASWTEL